jgi:succinate dehydrogenase hydrophobic anchor subunit
MPTMSGRSELIAFHVQFVDPFSLAAFLIPFGLASVHTTIGRRHLDRDICAGDVKNLKAV